MNVNKTFYAGRLTADPLLRFTPSNVAVCNFTVATNSRYLDKATNTWKDGDPCYLDVVVWKGKGEAINKHFSKGDEIYLEGRLEQQTWTDKQTNAKRSKIVLNASEFQFVGPKDGGKPNNAGNQDNWNTDDDGDEDIPY